jgi:spermidine synthase
MAGKGLAVTSFRTQDVTAKGFATRYYNRDIHAAALASPEFLRTR